MTNEYDENKQEAFKVDNSVKADWAMKKIRDLQRQIDDINKRAEIEKQNIFEWQIKEVDKLSKDQDYFKSLLDEYAMSNADKNGKFKFSSPYGKISIVHRKQWKKDTDELLKAFKGTSYVEETPKLKWGELKKQIEVVDGKPVFKETGEIVDGVTVEEIEKVNIKTEE